MHRNARKQNVASLFPDITMHDSLFASSLSCFLVNGKKKGEQQKGISWGINRNTDKSLKADATEKKKKDTGSSQGETSEISGFSNASFSHKILKYYKREVRNNSSEPWRLKKLDFAN